MASKKQGCSCEKCQECCKREPGWFLPEEVEQAALSLRLRSNEFILKFCKEHVADEIVTLSPATKPNTTECVFFNRDGLCDIHEVKPYECRKVMGCERPGRNSRLRELILRKWR